MYNYILINILHVFSTQYVQCKHTFSYEEKGGDLEKKLSEFIPKIFVASIDCLANNEVVKTF